jgi:hypothetical protein
MQALVVEIQRLEQGNNDTWEGVELSGVGTQGLLPKLDLWMLPAHFFPLDAGAKVSLPYRRTPLLDTVQAALPRERLDGFRQPLLGMLSFLGMQLGGNPDGAHAAFKGYAVDAVTARLGTVRLSACCRHVATHPSDPLRPS